MFEEYEGFLESISSEDYWSDIGVDVACSQVNKFDDFDWCKLKSTLSMKSEEWRGRCAESLSDVNDERALYILLELIRAEDECVAIHAIESINSLFLAGSILDVEDVLNVLADGFENSSRTMQLMSARLAKNLKS